jgi:hypothetical protein
MTFNTRNLQSEVSADIRIKDGTCYIYFAFDVGLSIDLTLCAKLISEPRESTRLQHKQKTPKYFDYTPLPLRISQHAGAFCFTEHDFCTRQTVDVTLFDFGAISVCYRIDLSGDFSKIIDLSEMLYENVQLQSDALQRVSNISQELRSAIYKPSLTDLYEDYIVFEVREFEKPLAVSALFDQAGYSIGQVLRSDAEEISLQQIEEALSSRVSYTTHDVAVIDWGAAFLYGDKMDDVRAVLEFANVELLEMRYQDTGLDQALETAYKSLNQGKTFSANLNTISQMQVDSAMMYEGVNNALKLLGDQYLARVYSQISKRFHLESWDNSILRKLETLNSIYSKLSDQAAVRRSFIMEAIIVALIAVEIVLSLVK